MLSDIENLDIKLGENHFGTQEREGSFNSNLPRRLRSFASNESENEDGNGGRPERNINSRIMPNVTTILSQVVLALR